MSEETTHRTLLRQIARRAMVERGLEPAFPPPVVAELTEMTAAPLDPGLRDLRSLLWASIDNDDSRDLDQLSVSEPVDADYVRLLVAVADVDSLVGRGSAVDGHARKNTTSVYTPAEIFPMLPEMLSTGLTSLNDAEDRPALVVDMTVAPDGTLAAGEVYRAVVRNHAKLAYDSVAAWMDGEGPMPAPVAAVPGMDQQLRVQDEVAARLETLRHRAGALNLETIEAKPVFDGDTVRDLATRRKNRAQRLIENLMIAANGVTARFLEAQGRSSVRRVVRSPRRWDRLIDLARQLGDTLPPSPDSRALEEFLQRRRAADPVRFPDLSLTVIKLLGPGEYVLEHPGDDSGGHFGLAVQDYAHSTAPNRRYPDLLTQRLLKAALAAAPSPYSDDELQELAEHCTRKEDDANKVERLVRKAAAALMLEDRIGERFDGIVTGASDKGTWVRILRPPVEGRVVAGERGLDVGDRVRVRLVHTDAEQGFIDFARA